MQQNPDEIDGLKALAIGVQNEIDTRLTAHQSTAIWEALECTVDIDEMLKPSQCTCGQPPERCGFMHLQNALKVLNTGRASGCSVSPDSAHAVLMVLDTAPFEPVPEQIILALGALVRDLMMGSTEMPAGAPRRDGRTLH
jgi:hypothetical protein